MLKTLSFTIFALFFCACAVNNTAEKTPVNKKSSTTENNVFSGLIVTKSFVKKNNESTDQMELYFRASIQDYYIKLCESNVTKDDLTPYIDKGITVEATLVEGNFDQCPGDSNEVQSRVGTYMVIDAIKS